MKRIFTLPLLLAMSLAAFAQQTTICKDLEALIAMEQQHHHQLIDFRVNPATQDYDLKYHRMEWAVDPAEHYISGTVTSYFVPIQPDFNEINFDLASNMTVDQVTYHGQSVNFTLSSDDNLQIFLPDAIAEGTLDSISIEYKGAPTATGFGSFETETHNNVPILSTLSEPYGAKNWWPCKQDLTDKVDSVDIIVTTPAEYRVGTNGVLIKEQAVGNGQAAYHWKHRYPIPAYLISIAVTNYAQFEDYAYLPDGDSILILNYVYPENLNSAQSQLSSTVEQMELFNELFGTYPFAEEKYGHAQFSWGGGMEHQTMSSMGGFSYGLQAHELAHQWFGDKVTCGSWQDIWLNEGFATYLTAITDEFLNPNPNVYYNWKASTIDYVTSQPYGSVWVDDTTNVSRIFSARLSYRKGALLLNMLRWKLGDEDFFQALRNYLDDPALAYGYARNKDLQEHLESVSGMDMTEFFQDWYYGEGYPSYQILYLPTLNGVEIAAYQETSHSSVDFYEMPIPIRLSDGSNDTMVVLDHTFSGQTFEVELPFTPHLLQFDPDKWIISRDNQVEMPPSALAKELNLEKQVVLSPNPASAYLEIAVSGLIRPDVFDKVSITDARGTLIAEFPLSSNVYKLNIAEWPAGIYWANFQAKEIGFSKQIVKQ